MYQNTSELEIALLEAKKQFQGNFGNKEKKATLYKALKDLLRNELGGSYKISKGFVLYGTQDNISPLIDMIIYQNGEIYKNDKFAIVESSQIKAIFTLISSFKPSNFYSLITNLCKIKTNIKHDIFAGIISYPCENDLSDDDLKRLKIDSSKNCKAHLIKMGHLWIALVLAKFGLCEKNTAMSQIWIIWIRIPMIFIILIYLISMAFLAINIWLEILEYT